MIKIVCVGRLKEEFKVLENELLRKIKPFTKIEISEIKEESGNSEKEILKKEENLLSKKIEKNYIVLTEEGKSIDSKEFSKLVENNTFVIGSSYGLSDNIKKNALLKLSLSKMTFNHQLARIILLEQIYRAYCIKKNLPYQR